MRIISGYLKGKKIDQPSNKFTRPLKDLTKESIFNILQHSNLINFSLEKSKKMKNFQDTNKREKLLFKSQKKEPFDLLKNLVGQTDFIEKILVLKL